MGDNGVPLKDVARLLGISLSTVYRRIDTGDLQTTPGPRGQLVTRESFEAARRRFAHEVELLLPDDHSTAATGTSSTPSATDEVARLRAECENARASIQAWRQAIRILNVAMAQALAAIADDPGQPSTG